MRSSSRPGKSGASHAPQAHTTRSASRRRPSSRTTAAPSGRASASTSSRAGRHGLRGQRLDRVAGAQDPGLGLEEREAHVVDGDAGEQLASRRRARTGSPRRAGRPRPRPPSRRRGARATPRPSSTTRAGSISCHSAQARRAERVCQASGPWQERMMRDSSPEPARTWPGATRSTSTTSQPASAQWRASDAPNTPAPTTTSEGRLLTARRLDGRPRRRPAAATAQCLTRRVLESAVEAL